MNKIKKFKSHPTQTLIPARQEPWSAENLTDLTNSIRERGQIEPFVVVRQPDATLVVADGNRRLRVFAQLGITSVSVVQVETMDELLSFLPAFRSADKDCQVAYAKRPLQFAGVYRHVISPLADRERRLGQSLGQKGKPRGSGWQGGGYITRVLAHFEIGKAKLGSLSMAAGLLDDVPEKHRPPPIRDAVEDVNRGRVQEDQIYERFMALGGVAHVKTMSQTRVTDDNLIRALSVMGVLNKFLAEIVFGDLSEVSSEVKARTLRQMADLKRSMTIATKVMKKE